MINVSDLTTPTESTNVNPSDNIFKELGKNTYDLKDLISELIDNSVAARQDNVLLKVEIEIYVDRENNPTKFIIRDNAKGISPENFGVAICPAGIVGGTTLNEHGLGMKQAIAAMGDLSYLATKTKNEDKARVVLEFKYGNLPIYRHDVNFECGTEICVKNIKPIVTTSSTSITRTLVPHLGARYRRFLKPDRKKLDLSIALIKDGPAPIYSAIRN